MRNLIGKLLTYPQRVNRTPSWTGRMRQKAGADRNQAIIMAHIMGKSPCDLP